MPTRARVQELVTFVEQGRVLEAIDTFYADDVAMQDNLGAPTRGRAQNRARLEQSITTIREIREHRAQRIIVDGDAAVIHWHFRFTLTDGTRLDFDQLALQQWAGDGADARIVHERFVFDSATLAAPPE